MRTSGLICPMYGLFQSQLNHRIQWKQEWLHPTTSADSIESPMPLPLLELQNHNASRRNHAATACHCRMSVREHVHEDMVEYTMSSGNHGLAHTHTLDDLDMVKINDAVKNAVLTELAKGYGA